MDQNIKGKRQATATAEKEIAKNIFAVAPGVWRMKDIFVNVYIIQNLEDTNWVLVDTGLLKSTAGKIKKMVATALGNTNRPSSIIMTHGHFDHVGSLVQLANDWNVPVYCHHMETPYLSGKAAYPPPDPTVGGGAMSTFSFLYPKGPVNVFNHLFELPEGGAVPDMPEWRWIHTPGHAPGHISLFRSRDGVLIAGDAFVTTDQESAIAVMTQRKEVNGPPKYFTPDWGTAARSVRELAALEPEVLATGHGHALYGEEARKALHKLARQFWQLGMPDKGRYVKEPAQFGDNGPTYIPPSRTNVALISAVAAAVLAFTGFVLYKRKQRRIGEALLATSIALLKAKTA